MFVVIDAYLDGGKSSSGVARATELMDRLRHLVQVGVPIWEIWARAALLYV